MTSLIKRAVGELSYRYGPARLDCVHLALTYRCNLACRTCGSWRIGREKGHDELSTAEVLDLVDEMHALDVREVYLVGSEVLLFEGWHAVLDRLHTLGIACSLLTNGSLVDDNLAARLMTTHPKRVTVSLDGDEAAHDRLRGQKSFERAMRGIALLAAARSKYAPETGLGAHMTISHTNVGTIRAVSDLCERERLDLSFQPVSYASQERIDRSTIAGEPASTNRFRPADGHGLNEEDLREVRRVYDELTSLGRYSASLLLITSIPPEKLARGEYPIGPCQSVRHEVVIEPDNRVITCANVDAYTIGNVREQNLREIWESERMRQLVKTVRGKDAPDICATCCNFRTNVTLETNVRAAVRHALRKTAERRR